MVLIQANALHIPLADGSVHCVVTSPPYWGLRDYGVERQLGLQPTLDEYIVDMIAVFREVWRVLRADGTLWLNLGDTYANGGKWGGHSGGKNIRSAAGGYDRSHRASCLKPKDLCGIPWRVAFALQEDGWYLRSDIIWHKPNPIPESVTDRPTKAHEYLFLLAKREHYYYDADAIKEPVSGNAHSRGNGANTKACGRRVPAGWDTGPGAHRDLVGRYKQNESFSAAISGKTITTRNKRSVWTIAPLAYSGAHFATFPEALVRPCILAGCPAGGIVFDPFVGSGTTLRVAMQLGRHAIGCDLSFDYLADHARLRTTDVQLEMCP